MILLLVSAGVVLFLLLVALEIVPIHGPSKKSQSVPDRRMYFSAEVSVVAGRRVHLDKLEERSSPIVESVSMATSVAGTPIVRCRLSIMANDTEHAVSIAKQRALCVEMLLSPSPSPEGHAAEGKDEKA